MVGSMYFRLFILGIICVNSVLIGLQTMELSEDYAWLFNVFDNIVLTIFVCELALKWYNGYFNYWRVGWNILDFFIILILLLGPTLTFLGSSRILRILRVLRAFRSLRSVSSLAGLSVVVQTIFQSIPDMANIALLLIIIMLVLSVAGVSLFGREFPEHFGDLGTAMFSMFVCVTQDGWMGMFNKFQDSDYYLAGACYFIVCIIVGAFVFANLIIAVVVTNLIFDVVWKLNEADDDEGEQYGDFGDLKTEPLKPLPAGFDIENFGKKGDILSNLMELGKQNLIDTTHGSLKDMVKEAAKLLDRYRQEQTTQEPAIEESDSDNEDAAASER